MESKGAAILTDIPTSITDYLCHTGEQEPVALFRAFADYLLESSDAWRSEDRAPYTPDDAAPDLTEQMEQMLREDLAGYLAFNAYHQAHSDKTEAIRALAEAILKVQALHDQRIRS